MKSVTVLGLGPMGQAMAGAYLGRGYDVTVWNRTPAAVLEVFRKGVAAGRGQDSLTSLVEVLRRS
ncbi:NAD(P)-binding domain-containing protein [Nonomuraea candida]|uniref:NAD(P)-binding domain-containing protein n=1 Tax=Nonomuraea candida TaxID=359159 RepID=UPI0005B8A7B5|nr:NAD(P)-binding domain-containing protein [Nonomuraea candida]